LGGILIAVVVIFLCVVLALFSRIRIAVEVIKESARCVVDMFLVLFFPLAPLFFFVVYMFAWLAGALTINSVGTATEVTTPATLLTFGADHSASGSSNGNPATSTLYLSDSSFWYADWVRSSSMHACSSFSFSLSPFACNCSDNCLCCIHRMTSFLSFFVCLFNFQVVVVPFVVERAVLLLLCLPRTGRRCRRLVRTLLPFAFLLLPHRLPWLFCSFFP